MYTIVRLGDHKFNIANNETQEILFKADMSLLQCIMILNYLNGGSPNSPEFSEFLGTLS